MSTIEKEETETEQHISTAYSNMLCKSRTDYYMLKTIPGGLAERFSFYGVEAVPLQIGFGPKAAGIEKALVDLSRCALQIGFGPKGAVYSERDLYWCRPLESKPDPVKPTLCVGGAACLGLFAVQFVLCAMILGAILAVLTGCGVAEECGCSVCGSRYGCVCVGRPKHFLTKVYFSRSLNFCNVCWNSASVCTCARRTDSVADLHDRDGVCHSCGKKLCVCSNPKPSEPVIDSSDDVERCPDCGKSWCNGGCKPY